MIVYSYAIIRRLASLFKCTCAIANLGTLILCTGCDVFAMVPLTTPPDCEMTVWNRQIDALSDPPYPERNVTGDEHVLMGTVRDAEMCEPLSNVTVMFDMTNHDGVYDGTQQGTVYTDIDGKFTIYSNRPGAYGDGNPHIHLYIGSNGYTSITVGYDVMSDVTNGNIEITLTPLLDH